MNESPAGSSRLHSLQEALRGVRARYDALDRGSTAPLRRCRTADEIALEASYYWVAGEVARDQRWLPHVVLLFPIVPHARREGFSTGQYLRRQLGDTDGAVLRFRRLVASRDRDELSHRLRAVLTLAGKTGAPVEWGIVGADILWFFAESDAVRRRWAQDFYAPRAAVAPQSSTSHITSHE